jgi:hypothetical protein
MSLTSLTCTIWFQLTALALRLVPLPQTNDMHWPTWLQSCVSALSSRGASGAVLLEFLEIAAEEVQRADLLLASKYAPAFSHYIRHETDDNGTGAVYNSRSMTLFLWFPRQSVVQLTPRLHNDTTIKATHLNSFKQH